MASERKWVAFYARDDQGRIVEAGVDTVDRETNICVSSGEEVADEVDIDNVPAFNAAVIADTELLAAAPVLLEDLNMVLFYYEAFRDPAEKIGPTEREDVAGVRRRVSLLEQLQKEALECQQ